MKQTKKMRSDAQGLVVISIVLTNAVTGERVRGNVTRTFKVSAAKVSAVAQVIESNFVRPDTYSLKE